MTLRLCVTTALAAILLLAGGCGDDAKPVQAADPSPGPSRSAEDAVLELLNDPDLGFGLSEQMARCQAREIVASDLPASTLAHLTEQGHEATDAEMDQFLAVLGEAEQTCVEELPDDPAAP